LATLEGVLLRRLYAASFIFNVGFGIANLTLILFAIDLGATAIQLGLIGMGWPAVYAATTPLSGAMTEKSQKKTLPMLGCIIASLTLLAAMGASSTWELMAASLLIGLAVSLFWPPIELWISQLAHRVGLRQSIGAFNVSWGLGSAVAPLVAGFAVGKGIALSLGLGVLGFGAAAVLTVATPWQPRVVQGGCREGAHDVSSSRHYLPLVWIANFGTWFSVGIVRSLFPKLATELSFGPRAIGMLLSVTTFSQVFMFVVLGSSSVWQYRLVPILISQVTALVSSILMYVGTGFRQFLPTMVLLGGSMGVSYFSSIYYSLDRSAGGGFMTGVHESLIGLGIVLGPLIGGITAQMWGLRSPYLVSAFVILLGIGVSLHVGAKAPHSS